jgi:hypothetical protein
MDMNMLQPIHTGVAQPVPSEMNWGQRADVCYQWMPVSTCIDNSFSYDPSNFPGTFPPIAVTGQQIAQPMLCPTMVANGVASAGLPVFWSVGQVPQGAVVFAQPFVNNSKDQVNTTSFVSMQEYQQNIEDGANESNRRTSHLREDFNAPVFGRRPRDRRPESEGTDALTSEEIEEMRSAVQSNLRKLQDPSSSGCFESFHYQAAAGAKQPYKSKECDNDTHSSASSTCTPESRIERWEDAVDDDASSDSGYAAKPMDKQSISDTDVEHMLAELESASSDRRKKAVEWVIGSCQLLAFTRRGCRIVQRAMEVAVWEDQERLVKNLEGLVLKALQSPHANYVLQKCFEIMPAHKLQFVLRERKGQGAFVARHRFGCRVLQRALEHCPPEQNKELIAEVLTHAPQLVRHTYGNFVMQHILQYGTSHQVHCIAEVLLADAMRYANHRIASHVMSCALTCCSPDDVQSLTDVLSKGRGPCYM